VQTGGKTFREAWIAGVKKHYPGEPKPSYISPWADMPEWERQGAAAVYDQARNFIRTSDSAASKLTRTQKRRFVALCWIAQIFKHIPDPKPSYVADWDDLPEWQRETDADIFQRIESDPNRAGWSHGNLPT
jgi:hypothetical protein